MFKFSLNITLLLLSFLIFQSCGEDCIKGIGPKITKKIRVDSFHTLLVDGPISMVEKSEEKDYFIEIRESKNLLDSLVVSVQDGVLRIGYKNGYYCINNDLEVEIKAPNIQDIKLRNYDSDSNPINDFVLDSSNNTRFEEIK